MACEPDNIKWENLGYSKKSRRIRALIVWLIAIGLIVASLIGIVIMKNKTTELKEEFKLGIKCPKKETTQLAAWTDMQLDKDDRTGLMTCYCKPKLFELNFGIYDLSFEDFTKADGSSDTNKYCGDWTNTYLI